MSLDPTEKSKTPCLRFTIEVDGEWGRDHPSVMSIGGAKSFNTSIDWYEDLSGVWRLNRLV